MESKTIHSALDRERWLQAEEKAKQSQTTLRDQFAQAAMTGLLSRPRESVNRYNSYLHFYESDPKLLAAYAYEVADAMLAARGGK